VGDLLDEEREGAECVAYDARADDEALEWLDFVWAAEGVLTQEGDH